MRLPFALLPVVAAIAIPAAAVAEGTLPSPEAPAPVGPEGSFAAQVSYCIGLNLGRGLRADGVEVDLGAIVAGLRDGVTDADPALTDAQVADVMTRFEQQMQQKAKEKMANTAADNLSRGEKFLQENAGKEGVQTTPSGLQYRVLTAGEGASPGPRDTVRCHYEGKLISGEVFDSSYKRGKPAEFPVGGVIAGWTEALQMMKVGAKWEVFLPAKIAYGEAGARGAIGPNETLIFQIELIDVVD